MDKPLILVVDDSEFNFQFASIVLKQEYELYWARNGVEALDILAQGLAASLVLLDVVMPGMSGYEVCARLKSNERTQGIPVVLITALDEVDEVQKGFELGAEEYLIRPVSPKQLKEVIQEHIFLA